MNAKTVLLIVVVLLLIGGSFWLFLKGGKETPLWPASSPLVVQPKDGFGKLVKKGPFEFPNRLETLKNIIGAFQGWEEVQGTSDKYVLLADRRTGELLPRVKVVLESSLLYGNSTSFFTVKINEDSKTSSDNLFVFDLSSESITFEEVERFVQPEDTVKVFLKKQMNKVDNLRDENGNFLADKIWLIGRGIVE